MHKNKNVLYDTWIRRVNNVLPEVDGARNRLPPAERELQFGRAARQRHTPAWGGVEEGGGGLEMGEGKKYNTIYDMRK